MRHTKFAYLLLLALSFLMSACHTSKTATQSATQNGEWHDVYMPVKVKLTSPSSMSLSGRATMVRDSLIHISMRVLGMEVAVVNMTSDSVTFVDKYHKYLFTESLGKIMGSHKLTLGDIQDIALGLQPNAPLNKLSFTNPGNDTPVTVSFSDFYSTPAGEVAQTVDVEAKLNKSDIAAQLLWSANSATWDSGRTVDFSAPRDKGYKTITTESVLKMFKSM